MPCAVNLLQDRGGFVHSVKNGFPFGVFEFLFLSVNLFKNRGSFIIGDDYGFPVRAVNILALVRYRVNDRQGFIFCGDRSLDSRRAADFFSCCVNLIDYRRYLVFSGYLKLRAVFPELLRLGFSRVYRLQKRAVVSVKLNKDLCFG